MPVIPMSNEAQILNAGSPVPIASASRASTMASAGIDLGDTITKIAGTLNQANRQATAEKNQLDIAEAENAFNDALIQNRMALQSQPLIEDDIDGRKTYNTFQQGMRDSMNALSENISNPEARRAFQVKANQATQRMALNVYADATTRRTEENKNQKGRIINQFSHNARADASTLEDNLAKAEIFIRSDQDLLPAMKESMLAEARKDIVWGAYNGALERAVNGQGTFAQASKILDTRGDVFDRATMDKLKDDVIRAENTKAQRDLQKQDRDDRASNRRIKKNTDEAIASYMGVLATGDEEQILAGRSILEAKIEAGQVDPVLANRYMNAKQVTRTTETAYTSTLTQRIIEGEDTETVVTEMQASPAYGLMEAVQAGLRAGTLQQFGVRFNSDPAFAQGVRDGAAKIEAAVGIPTAGASQAQQLTRQRNINNMRMQYYNSLAANPTVDPTALVNSILARNNIRVSAPAGESIPALKQQIEKKLIEARDNPNMTEAALRQLNIDIAGMQSRINELQKVGK